MKIQVDNVADLQENKTINRNEFVEMIKGWGDKIAYSGVTFANIVYFCPNYDSRQKNKQHLLQNLTTTRTTIGSNYQDKINRLLTKQEDEADFVANPMKGKTYPFGYNVPIVENKAQEKMLILVLEHNVVPFTILYHEGKPIDRKKAEEADMFAPAYFKPKEPTIGRGLIEAENDFKFLTVGIQRIIKIRLNGVVFKIVD